MVIKNAEQGIVIEIPVETGIIDLKTPTAFSIHLLSLPLSRNPGLKMFKLSKPTSLSRSSVCYKWVKR